MEEVVGQDSVGRGRKVVGFLLVVTANARRNCWRAVATAGEGSQSPQRGVSQESTSWAACRDEFSKVEACVHFFSFKSHMNICDCFSYCACCK